MSRQQQHQGSRKLPRAAKGILFASTGGHLAELEIAAEALNFDSDSLWVTFDSPQSRSVLKDRRHEFIDYIAPRQAYKALRALPQCRKLIASESFDFSFSTGSAIAVPGLLAGVSKGLPSFYLESIARRDGPSAAGKIAKALPRISTFAQYPSWQTHGWSYDISLLDLFQSRDVTENDSENSDTLDGRTKIAVLLGTIRPYRFDSLVSRVAESAKEFDSEVAYQLGSTQRGDLVGHQHDVLGQEALSKLILSSHVVVTHAGVGNILAILRLGAFPIVVARRASRNEHVDDHQTQIFGEIKRRGLAMCVEPDEVTPELLMQVRKMNTYRFKS